VFGNQSIYALLVGGIAMIIAGFLNFVVKERGDETSEEIISELMEAEQRPI
jgi:hypothetical protein